MAQMVAQNVPGMLLLGEAVWLTLGLLYLSARTPTQQLPH